MSTIWEKDTLSQRQLDRIDRIRSTRKKRSQPRRSSLIMSVAIFGHGCEDYTKPLKPVQFGLHVYSRSCMPGTASIGNKYRVRGMLDDIRGRFSSNSGDTLSILEGYAAAAKDEYQKVVDETAASPSSMASLSASMASGMSSFLFDKTFGFYDREPGENRKTIDPILYQGIGIHVVDIREKIIEEDGSVHYRRVFTPSERMDISNFNLIYKDGVKHVVKDGVNLSADENAHSGAFSKRKVTVPRAFSMREGAKKDYKAALAVLGFVGRQDRIMDLSLERLYDFFLLLGVDYVNIMDYTCRSCAMPMPPAVLENIYRIEQERSRSNPDRFGGSKNRHISCVRANRRNRGLRKTKRRG
jgi:hypothetical protein